MNETFKPAREYILIEDLNTYDSRITNMAKVLAIGDSVTEVNVGDTIYYDADRRQHIFLKSSYQDTWLITEAQVYGKVLEKEKAPELVPSIEQKEPVTNTDLDFPL